MVGLEKKREQGYSTQRLAVAVNRRKHNQIGRKKMEEKREYSNGMGDESTSRVVSAAASGSGGGGVGGGGSNDGAAVVGVPAGNRYSESIQVDIHEARGTFVKDCTCTRSTAAISPEFPASQRASGRERERERNRDGGGGRVRGRGCCRGQGRGQWARPVQLVLTSGGVGRNSSARLWSVSALMVYVSCGSSDLRRSSGFSRFLARFACANTSTVNKDVNYSRWP